MAYGATPDEVQKFCKEHNMKPGERIHYGATPDEVKKFRADHGLPPM